MATDGGGRSGFIMVRVKVADENDNAPKFLIREYKATIPSNLTTHSGFLKVGHKVCIQVDIYTIIVTYNSNLEVICVLSFHFSPQTTVCGKFTLYEHHL
jgi:hypothetical protein